MISEDVDELRLVLRLEQVGEDAGGERGERFVGRGEDGERAVAREGSNKAASRERRDQSREVRGGDGEADDGLRWPWCRRRRSGAAADLRALAP